MYPAPPLQISKYAAANYTQQINCPKYCKIQICNFITYRNYCKIKLQTIMNGQMFQQSSFYIDF